MVVPYNTHQTPKLKEINFTNKKLCLATAIRVKINHSVHVNVGWDTLFLRHAIFQAAIVVQFDFVIFAKYSIRACR